MTADRGLRVSAYGTYHHAGEKDERPDRERWLDTAVALGTDTVRVWAGRYASAECAPAQREAIEGDLRELVALGAERGLRIATEFHVGTLTDDARSAERMLRAVPGLWTLWQPPVAWTPEQDTESLRLLEDRVLNLHVYALDGDGVSLPLKAKEALWRRWLTEADRLDRLRYATLEFVKDDSPEQFLTDAATLKGLLRAIG